jgi:hypothetical protein
MKDYIEATYDPHKELVTVNGKTFIYGKYWKSEKGVSDYIGLWHIENEKFLPDGYFDHATGWIRPLK